MQEKTAKRVAQLRRERQHLNIPAEKAEYEALFRQMSPVRCTYWCMPGLPPSLEPRAAFDDRDHCFSLRAQRKIVKGRFQGGNIGYIFADEWPLFIAAYRRRQPVFSERDQELLALLEHEGPLTIGVMRELTGFSTKEITSALHRLQEKFLVFEDQEDNDWERSWLLFSEAFPDIPEELPEKAEAIGQLLLRFARLNIWIDAKMVVSYYRLLLRDVKAALALLEKSGRLLPFEGGWILPEDRPLLEKGGTQPEAIPAGREVLALHRNDYLVKSQEHLLAGNYAREGLDVLWYLLVDGEIAGAVLGRFHNGPFELEDVALALPPRQAWERKGQVLAAIRQVSDPEVSPLKRYLGERL